MFKKILIANRGEIALRVICACKELGIATVAIYSEADRNSLHVRFADEAVCIGPPRSTESYLNIPVVISAAEITNVDAIHPGYGFLSENPYFAEVCESCGLRFIGPRAEVIRLMGDKAIARATMAEAGLPILPGTGKLNGDPEQAQLKAAEIGYPVIVKAVGGGGGRGMKIVHHESDLQQAMDVAQNEANAAFGNPEIYIEKYLESPRHIEFQVLADEDGNVIHLGERECSIQRRHQKLIEEAPSPYITSDQRAHIGSLVCEAMGRIGYTSCGTVEFLFDGKGGFYFMEMNTRIQVEHPVTEMITEMDLIKEQIRIASGEPLSLRQDDIQWSGWSLECRINAENPVTFAPSPGKITSFNVPNGPGIRVDTAAYTECVIPPHYDSLVAKLIAYGRDRNESIRRMSRALEMFVVEGIQTTIPIHQQIIRDKDFLQGKLSTHFMDRYTPKLR
jgi:acetyl-CoA carboxylase, biotin carboxylase subunit